MQEALDALEAAAVRDAERRKFEKLEAAFADAAATYLRYQAREPHLS